MENPVRVSLAFGVRNRRKVVPPKRDSDINAKCCRFRSCSGFRPEDPLNIFGRMRTKQSAMGRLISSIRRNTVSAEFS